MILEWRKSSRSDGVDDKACVEVAEMPADVGPYAEAGAGAADPQVSE